MFTLVQDRLNRWTLWYDFTMILGMDTEPGYVRKDTRIIRFQEWGGKFTDVCECMEHVALRKTF